MAFAWISGVFVILRVFDLVFFDFSLRLGLSLKVQKKKSTLIASNELIIAWQEDAVAQGSSCEVWRREYDCSSFDLRRNPRTSARKYDQ